VLYIEDGGNPTSNGAFPVPYGCGAPLEEIDEADVAPFTRIEFDDGSKLGFALPRGAGRGVPTGVAVPPVPGVLTPGAEADGARELPVGAILEAFRRCRLLIGNFVLRHPNFPE